MSWDDILIFPCMITSFLRVIGRYILFNFTLKIGDQNYLKLCKYVQIKIVILHTKDFNEMVRDLLLSIRSTSANPTGEEERAWQIKNMNIRPCKFTRQNWFGKILATLFGLAKNKKEK